MPETIEDILRRQGINKTYQNHEGVTALRQGGGAASYAGLSTDEARALYRGITGEDFSADRAGGFSQQFQDLGLQVGGLSNYILDPGARQSIDAELMKYSGANAQQVGAFLQGGISGNTFTNTPQRPEEIARQQAIAQNDVFMAQERARYAGLGTTNTNNQPISALDSRPTVNQFAPTSPTQQDPSGMREISPGMYVPIGSPADRLVSGTDTTATLPRQALIQGALNPKGQEANTLYDFYSAQGTPLPSLQERGGLFERLGLGGAGEYRGTASQNNALLNALKQQASFGNTITGDVDIAKTVAADLLGNKTGLVIPPTSVPMSLTDYGNALLQQIFNPQQTQEGKDNDLLTNRIAELTRQSGNEQRDLLAEQEKAGVQRLEQEKRDLETALRNEAQIFLQRQQSILNQQGVTRGAMVGQEREAEADRVLNMGRLSVALDAVNGSYMAAMNKAQGIVDAKYSQIENEIKYTQLLLEANRDKMSRKEQQQAQALELFLQFRSEALADQKAEENSIYELAIEAQKNGASAATTQKIMSSTSRQEALGLAGTYIGKLDRDQQAFENSLKRSQLAMQQEELGLQRIALAEERATAQQQQVRQAEEATASLDARIAEISRLSEHPGLDSRVGPNALARGFFSIQDRAGAGQDFAGSIQQLVSKDTLDTLLNLKRAGGTLGALSDKEAALLTNAATKLGAWEKKKDGIGTGEWNIDQTSFKRELKTIQDLAITARNRALGDLVSEEDANDI